MTYVGLLISTQTITTTKTVLLELVGRFDGYDLVQYTTFKI